jgi:hypothetical protein
LSPEPNDYSGSPQQISAAVQEVAEKAQLLVREEIELAKAEVTIKAKKLARGGAIGGAAAVFVLGALVLLLHGFAWLIYWLCIKIFGLGADLVFVGFFIEALLLLILAAIAGLMASKLFKAGSPPTPEMAIQEAQAIKETVDKARG